MNPTALLTLSDRFIWILEAIYAATAARYRSPGWTIPMIWAVCNRIRRVERRVMKLLELFRAGKLPVEGARVRRSRAGEKKVSKAEAVKLPHATAKLPRRFGWLLPMVPCAAANLACNLRMVLAEPEMKALLAASAQARRAMMTLGHMLMIEPELIAPKPVDPDVAVAEVSAAVGEAPTGWPGFLPPAPPPEAPDFRYFRDGTRPQGPPSSGAG